MTSGLLSLALIVLGGALIAGSLWTDRWQLAAALAISGAVAVTLGILMAVVVLASV